MVEIKDMDSQLSKKERKRLKKERKRLAQEAETEASVETPDAPPTKKKKKSKVFKVSLKGCPSVLKTSKKLNILEKVLSTHANHWESEREASDQVLWRTHHRHHRRQVGQV